ncbi:4Fe-4S dicluster domain-containing protein [Candidatus Bathyarchaeota archaeon]|nr:4Fe-4S dicluster domain-containing protein [Candidatus Bathyarchaeota archaeon]NIU81086.1 4Fe-4S dicluster domain-containing protein [Candidatus Bathyarchaeota archaeon]NIV67723.1 4Fe-4S dicluster domain-containing protein [Candidatus Bathyarchaeota archaeon]NIW16265.1 4Fe-4S dicluster domain-containing protein [Candidatus Bathyarchaeota archaeon]
MSFIEPIWIARDYIKCSGCRKCEIACSLHHEGKIWPEASRIRVFMLVPGAEVPHFCVQCQDYPCVEACPTEALSINRETAAVSVAREHCTACGQCTEVCPGNIPHVHPTQGYAIICDLCHGEPKCVEACQEGDWNALKLVTRKDRLYKLYARTPEEITKDLIVGLYGEAAKELM